MYETRKNLIEVSQPHIINEVSVQPPDILMVGEYYQQSSYSHRTCQYHPKMQYNLSITPEYIDLLRWLKQFKEDHDEELRLREENPTVKELYNQYQAMVKLVQNPT